MTDRSQRMSIDLVVHGGCISKLAPLKLTALLREARQLALEWDARNVAPCWDDDAGVLSSNLCGYGKTLASTEIMSPAVSDGRLAAAIAAEHALTDIWASGGRPTDALVQLVISASDRMDFYVSVLAGLIEQFRIHDVRLIGGHTLVGSEPLIGLTVFGECVGISQILKSTPNSGDVILMSKPIALGAIPQCYLDIETTAELLPISIKIMQKSNKQAAVVAMACAVSAMTDVTGFGLLGHLAEMTGNRVGAIVRSQDVPAIANFPSLLSRTDKVGFRLKMSLRDNFEYVSHTSGFVTKLNHIDIAHLLNPQTNGPILVSVPPSRKKHLIENGFIEIGEITRSPGIYVM